MMQSQHNALDRLFLDSFDDVKRPVLERAQDLTTLREVIEGCRYTKDMELEIDSLRNEMFGNLAKGDAAVSKAITMLNNATNSNDKRYIKNYIKKALNILNGVEDVQ